MNDKQVIIDCLKETIQFLENQIGQYANNMEPDSVMRVVGYQCVLSDLREKLKSIYNGLQYGEIIPHEEFREIFQQSKYGEKIDLHQDTMQITLGDIT